MDALFDLLIRYLVHSKFPRDNTTRNHFEPNKAIVDPIYTDADVIRGCNLISKRRTPATAGDDTFVVWPGQEGPGI